MLDRVFHFLVMAILACVEFLFLRKKIPVEEDVVEEPDEVIDDRPNAIVVSFPEPSVPDPDDPVPEPSDKDAQIIDLASWKTDHPQRVRVRHMNG